MKKTILLTFGILFVSVVSAFAATPKRDSGSDTGQAPSSNGFSLDGKLVNAQEIMKEYEQGKDRVKVIVGLIERAEIKEETNWKSEESVHSLRTGIANRQASVLSSVTPAEFALRHRYENFPGFSGEITFDGLNKLLDNPLVASVEPDKLEYSLLAQGIPLINGTTYRSTYNGGGIAIAISDTGVDYTHARLGNGSFPNNKVIGGYDFGDSDSDPMPNGNAHGTACAGIAAGDLGTVGDYIGGVAYNARIYALKITQGGTGSAWDSDVIDAWDWCITNQFDHPEAPIMVISHSFGGGQYFSPAGAEADRPFYAAAADRVVAAGITLLAASGNDGYCSSLNAPAAFSSVISVGAVYDADIGTYDWCVGDDSCATPGGTRSCDSDEFSTRQTSGADVVAAYSNTAAFLDILAPSHCAYTTDIVGSGGYSSGDYDDCFGGTSAACPYAAGAVACLQEAAMDLTGSYLTADQVRSSLTNTGDNITDSKVDIIKPRVNLAAAIESIGGQNNAPLLYNGRVYPQEGTIATDFEYLVYYLDPDGDPPSYVRVHIDGTSQEMNFTGSGTAAVGEYSCTTRLSIGDAHSFIFDTEDTRGGSYTTIYYYDPVVTDGTGTDLSRTGDQWNELSGDGDHIPEAGETIGIRVRLKSISDLTDVSGALSSSTSGVNITHDELTYADISAGETKWPGNYATTEFNFADTRVCDFTLHLTYDRNSVTYYQDINFSQTIHAQGTVSPHFDFEVSDVATYESANGDGDGIPESGEFVDFDIDLENIGTADAYDVRARVTNVNVGHIDEQWREYFDIPLGNTGRGQHPFGFSGDGIPAGFAGWITVDMEIESAGENIQYLINKPIFEAKADSWINVNPQEWNFGASNTSTDVVKTFTISNPGAASLTVSGINISPPEAEDTTTSWNGSPITILPGGSENIDVTIETSTLSGLIERQITVVSDASPAHTNGDRIVISGLVSDAPPTHKVPTPTQAIDEVDCSDNILAWCDGRNGNSDIYTYDLVAGNEEWVCEETHTQEHARIGGGIVAWTDYRNDDGSYNGDIFGYDTSTGRTLEISVGATDDSILGTSNGKVAYSQVYHQWTTTKGTQYVENIYVYDAATETTANITNYTVGSQVKDVENSKADFGGDIVVWQEKEYTPPGSNPSSLKLMKYQIGVDSAPVEIASGDIEVGPKTNNGRIVWTYANEEPKQQIWIWDGSAPRQLTTEEVNHAYNGNLAIGSDVVVYDKHREGRRLFAWDLTDNEESLVVENAGYWSVRMDGDLLGWTYDGGVYYTFLNQADLAVESADISFSDEQPVEGSVIDVNVTVHNLNPWDTTDEITVQLFDGNPSDANSEQLGFNEIISGGIVAQGSAIVEFNDIPVGIEGAHDIFATVSVPSGDNPANNDANQILTVLDEHLEGPVLFKLAVQEYNGNGDGRIESDEEIMISWQASHVCGINSSWCTIDANDIPASGTYYVILGPHAIGNHDFTISATDGDISPETSQSSDSFMVSFHGDINEDGEVNFLDFGILAIADQWLQPPGTPSADIAPSPVDGFVNFLDLAILAKDWLSVGP